MQFRIYFSSGLEIKKTLNFFYWVGFSCLKAAGPFREDSLTSKFPGIPGAHLIELRRMEDWINFQVAQWF